MDKPTSLVLCLSIAAVSTSGCRSQQDTVPPDPIPAQSADDVETSPEDLGDPTEVEGEDIGRNVTDEAEVVEPGPAEVATDKPNRIGMPD